LSWREIESQLCVRFGVRDDFFAYRAYITGDREAIGNISSIEIFSCISGTSWMPHRDGFVSFFGKQWGARR
jgi:hypothetical protein